MYFERQKGRNRDSDVDKKKKNSNDATMLRGGVVGKAENNARQHREGRGKPAGTTSKVVQHASASLSPLLQTQAMEGTRPIGKKAQVKCKLRETETPPIHQEVRETKRTTANNVLLGLSPSHRTAEEDS